MNRKQRLQKIYKLTTSTIDFLKRSSGRKFRQLTIGKTGTKFSEEVINVIHQTDKDLRKVWDYRITHIARLISAKISKIQVKVPSKKKFFHDESLLTDFDLEDAYTITQEDFDEVSSKIEEIISTMSASLLGVIEKQQKVAFLLGERKASVTLYNSQIPTSLSTLTEEDLKILKDELEFQKDHLEKFMKKLKKKYDDLLYAEPGESWPVYKTPQELMENVKNVDSTSVHQLDMYAIAGIEAAMMMGTVEPHKQGGVGGGIWHTMHDGNVCPECRALDGVWMSWDEFHSIYKNTLCNGSCRCGELFEPTNNTTDPYSDTYGKDYYLDDKTYPKPCIKSVSSINLSVFKLLKSVDMSASPGSIGCALVQNSENSARALYDKLSPSRRKIADRFSVSPKVNFAELPHFYTPSSAQFRTQLYKALDSLDGVQIRGLSNKIQQINLVSLEEINLAGGKSLTSLVQVGNKLLVNSELSPLQLKQSFTELFSSLVPKISQGVTSQELVMSASKLSISEMMTSLKSMGVRHNFEEALTKNLISREMLDETYASISHFRKLFGNRPLDFVVDNSVESKIFAYYSPSTKKIHLNSTYIRGRSSPKIFEEMVAKNSSPKGCTTWKSIVDHELGHRLTMTEPKILRMYKRTLKKKDILEGLSIYATLNRKEFYAEAISEFLNNVNPREIARTIGELLLD